MYRGCRDGPLRAAYACIRVAAPARHPDWTRPDDIFAPAIRSGQQGWVACYQGVGLLGQVDPRLSDVLCPPATGGPGANSPWPDRPVTLAARARSDAT